MINIKMLGKKLIYIDIYPIPCIIVLTVGWDGLNAFVKFFNQGHGKVAFLGSLFISMNDDDDF